MKNLCDFKNLYKNTPILIMGCGASLNNYNQDIYNKCITIGVNRVKYTPQYLLIQDNIIMDVEHGDYNPPERMLNSQAENIFLMHYRENYIKYSEDQRHKLVDISNDVLSWEDTIKYDDNYLYRSYISFILAMFIGIYMGSDHIGLIGIDQHGLNCDNGRTDARDDVFRHTNQYVNMHIDKMLFYFQDKVKFENLSDISHLEHIKKVDKENIKHFMIK
jgi:hypothetical protein